MISSGNRNPVKCNVIMPGQERDDLSEQQALSPHAFQPIQSQTLNRTRKLRVALITSSYNYIRDGVALTLNRLVEYLERNEVEVLVFAPVAKTPALAHNGTIVPVRSLPLPFRPEYRVALGVPRGVRKRMREFNPDIIHLTSPDILGYSALKLALKWKIPVVASYHTRFETYFEHYGAAVLRKPLANYLRKFYGMCSELYVPSASMAEVLVAEGVHTKIRLWSRGVDTSLFHPNKRSQGWRSKMGIGPDELVVAFVGRLVREKRLSTLVKTFHGLREARVAHRSLIVGDGPEESALRKQLPDGVFTGALEGEDLACAYASADIFLFPSDTESFGNVTLEAMASGLPAVCADATGSRSLVDVGATGFLGKAESAETFIEHVRTLAKDAGLRQRMGMAARERSLRTSWDDVMGQILGYYNNCLTDPART
jgi:glycosyltransferase involved in cell wall biosynthesis